MVRKRPCRICRCWFVPNPRARRWQRACDRPQCQRERHRLACERWRTRNADYDRDRRLRERLRAEEVGASGLEADPLRALDWSVARDAVGLEVTVFVEETGKVLHSWARDAVIAQGLGIAGKSRQVPARGVRDDMGIGGRGA